MNDFGIASVAGITVICYLVGVIVKAVPADLSRYIPAICGLVGLALGIVCYYCGMPGFPASDPVTAAAVGAVSGFAATGINQIGKQLLPSSKEEG